MKKAMKVMLGLVAVLVAFSMIGCGEPDLEPTYLFQKKAAINAAVGTVTLEEKDVTWSIKGCDNGDTDPNNDLSKYDATGKIYLEGNVVKVADGYDTNGEDVVVRVFGTSTKDSYKYGWYDITLNIEAPVIVDPADVLLDTIEVTFNNAVDNLNWVVISQFGAFTLNGEQVTSKDEWWNAGNERTTPYYIKDGEKCELFVESTKAGATDFVLEIWDTGACIDISTQIGHWIYKNDGMNAPTFTTTASAIYDFKYGKKLNIIIERAANVVTVNVYEVIGELDKAEEEPEEGEDEEPSVAGQVATGSWDFADLATVTVDYADGTSKIESAEALAAAASVGTLMPEAKFYLKGDVEYSSTTGSMKAVVKSLDAEGVPILYNKYEATKTLGEFSAGCLQGAKDFLVVEKVQGPFTVTMNYSTNSSSDKTDRYAYIKINGEENKDSAYPESVPSAGSTMTVDYTGTDVVDVVFGATNSVRVYDVTFTAK